MKKSLLFSLILFVFCAENAFSQGLDSLKKRWHVDVFYGGPNLVSRVVEASHNTTGDAPKTSVSGIGPIGIRADYMLGRIISLGLEIHRASSVYKRIITAESGGTKYYFRDQLSIDRTRIYPRIAAHFGRDRLDVYAQVGLGIALWTARYKVTENQNEFFNSIGGITLRGGTTVVAFRSGFGMRYMITQNLGFNADLGLGGPFYTLGVSGRF